MIKFYKLYQISKWKNTQFNIFKDLWECYDHEEDIFWQRSLRSWEVESLQELSNIIHSRKLNSKDDLLIWKIEENPYTVSEGIDFLSRSRESQAMSWSFIWKLKIPPKAIIFLWKLHREILPTRVFLHKRIGNNFNQTLCPRCKGDEESSHHIFWQCVAAKKLWVKVIAWWGFQGRVFFEDLTSMWKSCSLFSQS